MSLTPREGLSNEYMHKSHHMTKLAIVEGWVDL